MEARQRRHQKRDWEEWPDETDPFDESLPATSSKKGSSPRSPHEQAYREARKAANRRIGFMSHLIPYLAVNVFLLLVAGPRAAFWTAVPWGVGLGLHYFFAIVAPDLRKRWIDQEVDQRVGLGVSRERVSLEGAHSKQVEELSASIAHEIRNPITAAKSLVQQMGEDPAASDNVEYANVALEELERVERSISHLLRYARDEDVVLREVSIPEVIESALETFRDRLETLGVTVQQDVQAAGPMRGDPEKLRRVIINLIGNSLDAFAGAHTEHPTVVVQAGENLAGTEIWLRLKDNGPGMEPERLTRIFSPFYTSKETGTGLGLAISKKVVDAHGGSIEAHSDPGSGTEFVLTFPKQIREPQGSPS
ncbi:MAG: HAMP domain-containing histidine kinase [bacterium]|nr:HAMP domain-containing histidine kinase [bacterium]